VIAGASVQYKPGSQHGPVYTPLSKARQVEGVKFLNDQVFRVPAYLVRPDIAARIEANGMLNRVGNVQNRVLTAVFNDARLNRLVEQPAMNKDAYTLVEMTDDVQRGVWSGRYTNAPRIDTYRRRPGQLPADGWKLNPPPAATPANVGSGTRLHLPLWTTRRQLRGEPPSLRDEFAARSQRPRTGKPGCICRRPTIGSQNLDRRNRRIYMSNAKGMGRESVFIPSSFLSLGRRCPN
jgi:hypothetical protein